MTGGYMFKRKYIMNCWNGKKNMQIGQLGLLEGARRVGKSTIALELQKMNMKVLYL